MKTSLNVKIKGKCFERFCLFFPPPSLLAALWLQRKTSCRYIVWAYDYFCCSVPTCWSDNREDRLTEPAQTISAVLPKRFEFDFPASLALIQQEKKKRKRRWEKESKTFPLRRRCDHSIRWRPVSGNRLLMNLTWRISWQPRLWELQDTKELLAKC